MSPSTTVPLEYNFKDLTVYIKMTCVKSTNQALHNALSTVSFPVAITKAEGNTCFTNCSIEVDLKLMSVRNLDWIHLAIDSIKLRALLSVVLIL
jgi:hypothetical protein